MIDGRQIAELADPIGQMSGFENPALRHHRGSNARAAGRDWHYLRITAQRHH